MGGKTAASTILGITISAMKRAGNEPDAEEMEALREKVESSYDSTTDIRHAASRLWVDGIIKPCETRAVLSRCLDTVTQHAEEKAFQTGVFQV